jgi:hypothetical protein
MGSEKTAQYISEWEDAFRAGEAFKQETAWRDSWQAYENGYKGLFGSKTKPMNIIFPLIRAMVPRVYFRDPRVIVTPTRPGFGTKAKILESVDNYLLRIMNAKGALKTMIFNAGLYGTGIGKSGFDSEYGFHEAEEKRRDTSEAQKFFTKTGFWQTDSIVTEYNEAILPGMPWYQSVDPGVVTYPYGCRIAKDTPYVIHTYVRHIDDVRADPKYRNAKKIEPNRTIASKYIQDFTQLKKTNSKFNLGVDYVEIREVLDLRRKQIYNYAVGYNEWLRNDTDPLLSAGNYYDVLTFNENVRSVYGISDVAIIEPNQTQLNEINTMFSNNLSMHVLKFLVNQNMLDPATEKALRNRDFGALLKMNLKPGDKISDFIQAFFPPFDLNFVQAMSVVREDARETVGFSRNEAGEYDRSTRRTAYEASIVHNASQIRVDERRDSVADVVGSMLPRINKYIFKYWTEDKFVQVLGPQAKNFWVAYNGAMLEGDYLYEVDMDTSQQKSAEIRKNENLELLKVIGMLPPEALLKRDAQGNAMPIVSFEGLLKSILDQYPSIDTMQVLNPIATQPEGDLMGLDEFTAMTQGGIKLNADIPNAMQSMS